jgi:hypothetical protein
MVRSKQNSGILSKIKLIEIRMLRQTIKIICIRLNTSTIKILEAEKIKILKTHLQCLDLLLKI